MRLIVVMTAAIVMVAASCGSGEPPLPERVYVSDDGHAILFDTEKEDSVVLTGCSDYVFAVFYESSTREWIIAERAPAIAGPGRVETEHLLFNVPRRLLVDVTGYDGELSGYGIFFKMDEGMEVLVALNSETWEEVTIPLEELLSTDGDYIRPAMAGEDVASPAAGRVTDPADRHHDDMPHDFGGVTGSPEGRCELLFELVIELGEDDEQIGQGVTEKWLEMGRLIYAAPSFAVHDGILYLVDAINFRVMVYDIPAGGELLHYMYYPDNNREGSIMVMRDIAVDDRFIYLLSVYDYAVYVFDAVSHSLVNIIDGSGTPAGTFGDLRSVNVDHHGNLIIFDAYDNMLYTYSEGQQVPAASDASVKEPAFVFSRAVPIEHGGQLVAGPDGTVFRAMPTVNGFEVSKEDGVTVGVFETVNMAENAVVAGTCINGNIYVRVAENGMSQYGGTVFLYVISSGGKMLRKCELEGWTGGPMQRNLVVTLEGEVWEALFDGDSGDPDKPPASIAVRRIF